MDDLKPFIRDIPDFPRPGILFKDITPLLKDPGAFQKTIEHLEQEARQLRPDLILGIESRGFLFGGALAMRLGKGMIIARKPGKLPYKTTRVSYDLEYGSNTLELHIDAISKGQRVMVIDDLLATGGTAAACGELIRGQGGVVAGYLFVVELAFLEGRTKLPNEEVRALLAYS